jgi:hypothetical protein
MMMIPMTIRTIKMDPLNKRSDEFIMNLPANPAENQRRDITSRAYQVRVETVNEKERSVDAVIATENPVRVFDWNLWEPVEEILLMSGCRIPADKQVPMLDTHNRFSVEKQLGSTRNLRIEGGELVGTNSFSSSKEAEHAWTLTREKHLRDNSIGYRVINSVIIPAGEKAEVAGKMYQASATMALRVTTEWEVKENSICVIGADFAAKNRSENKNINLNGKDQPMEDFKKWLSARGLDYDKLTETTRAALKTDFDAEQKRAEDEKKKQNPQPAKTDNQRTDNQPAESPEVIAKRAVETERKRVADIQALGGEDVKTETITRCITEGLTVDQARAEILKDVRSYRGSNVNPVPMGIAAGNNQTTREMIEDGLLLRAGFEDAILKDKTNGEKRCDLARKTRNLSMLDICRMALTMENRSFSFYDPEETIRTAFSTHSLATILGNVANKALLRGYELIPETWPKWCTIGSASDFKTMTRVRLSQNTGLSLVGSGGKIQHGSTEEESEQFSIATYAKIIAFTRTQIINDDLEALTKVPQGMGSDAKRLIGDLVYTHLLANGNMGDGAALFVAGHGNLNTTHTLAEGTLKTALINFRKQTNKAGKPINVPVKFLICPPDLMWTAKELLKSGTIVVAGAGDVVRGSTNVLGDLAIEAIVEPRLASASFSGYSTSTWYLAGDKNLVDTIEVAFLRGKQEPTLEQLPMSADVLGIQYRIYHDAGCKALDYRGLAKCTA